MHGHGPSLPSTGFLGRLKSHKVIEWTLAYAALAYTLLHGVEMVAEALEWPHVIARVLTLVLILGVPVIATLAWYQGAQGLKRISGPELAILTVLLFIAGSVLWGFSRSSQQHETAKAEHAVPTSAALATLPGVAELPPPASTPSPPAPRTAVAVLPFVNLTGDASKEYLGDGMAEELINTLTKVQGLKVPARTSTFAYKSKDTDIRRIARDLGVGTVLEGSVRSAGKRIRITAQLINAQDGLHLWSETYDEDFTDIFKLQDKLAREITGTLQRELGATAGEFNVAISRTSNVEAYQLFLQARAMRQNDPGQGWRVALRLLDKAVELDPKFSRALAERAFVRILEGSPLFPPNEALSAAEHDLAEALRIDPTVDDARWVAIPISRYRRNWLEAETQLRAALIAEPANTDVRLQSSYFLGSIGKVKDAVAAAGEAYRLAPAAGPAISGLIRSSLAAGDDNKAADLPLLSAADSDIIRFIRWTLAIRTRSFVESERRASDLLPAVLRGAKNSQAVSVINAGLADPAKVPQARRALDELVSGFEAQDMPMNSIYAGFLLNQLVLLGAIDSAYEFANRHLNVRFIETLFWTPEMRDFRRDARFQALVTRLGMKDYWRKFGPPDNCDLKNGVLTCH